MRRHGHGAPFGRRWFLRGALGATVGLPFLESLAPQRALARDARPPKRFLCFFNCNGVNMNRFFPSAFGALTPESFSGTALEPLAAFAPRCLIPRGIHAVPRGYNLDGGAGDDHAKGMGHKLTAQFLADTPDEYALGISVDQAIARGINPEGRQALTLRVGRKKPGVLGHISYTGPEQPVTGENNPWLAYQDFMGLGSEAGENAIPDAEALRRRSVLDLVNREFDDLRGADLSRADRQKIEAHFDSIRDVELSLAGSVGCNLGSATEADLRALETVNVDSDSEFARLTRLQIDVIALSLACDYTRSATLQIGNGAGGPIFTWDGMQHQYNHHKLSHGTTRDDGGAQVAGYEQMLFDIDVWHMKQLNYLLTRLDAYQEGDGSSVLDNTVVVYANELSNGKAHDFKDLPWLIFGGAGYFKLAEYVQLTPYPAAGSEAPHNKLLTMFMNAVGIPTTNFGGERNLPGEFDVLKA